ncbi:MAG: TAT-variant-translocated molybdopterin oxidoreductase [Candidatus Polarisedimenticolia bacterium]
MSNDRWWRSPEALAGDESVRDFVKGEFPEGADRPPTQIGRRQMLTLMGATVSMAWLSGCRRPEERIVPYVAPPEEIIPGVPQYYATTMPFGHSAIGLIVETHEGRPNKIEGNPSHPSSLGGSSALVQAAIYGLYDPDRSRSIHEGDERRTWEQFVAAAKGLREGFAGSAGEGLAVVCEPFSSPTQARLAARFGERFPKARWITWAPCSDENADRGLAMAAGRPRAAMSHPKNADVILSLDADFLVSDPEAIRHAREFADRRRLGSEHDSMNRLYVVESRMSPTGGSSDHRLRLQAGRMGAFVEALAAAVGMPGSAARQDAGWDASWMRSLAADLTAHRGRGLIVAGAHLSPAVHAAVAMLNAHLGNVGATVTYHAPADSRRSSLEDLGRLVSDMNAGSVKALVVMGANPVYDAPADLKFAEALGKVPTVIHLGLYRDETGRRAHWHVPQAHFLESWGDARAVGGTLSVIQPLIAPLHGGRTMAELLALWESGEPATGHELVRQTWAGILGTGPLDENAWTKVLHDGLLEGSALAAETLTPAASLPAGLSGAPASDGPLEIVFHPSPVVHDGRFANVAWLQELPEPVTKLTWDNAAWLSPATARSLGVKTGDMVRLTTAAGSLEIAALEVPGQADGSIALPLGYGRRAAGQIGDGVGFDTYALRASSAPWIASAHAERTGGTHLLATTQDHWAIDAIGTAGRDERLPAILRSASLSEYREHPHFVHERFEHPELESIYPDHPYESSPQWGMTIDLTTCTGCNACVIACQSENNIPVVGKEQVAKGREMHWIRVDRYYAGDPEDPDRLAFQPVTCQHCENAPCEQVCPVGATVHDHEGLNAMVYNRCIGTRYCSNNCSYKVRRFNYFNFTKDTPELLAMANNPDVTVRSRGVMEKCTFCTQRIQAAKIDARAKSLPMAPDAPQTACQQACPARAISFGNILDPAAEVVKQRASNRSYQMLAELNNRPRVSYLARIRNPREEAEG